MAAVRSDQYCCSICLELFDKPVTAPCGHNFCKTCITQYWDMSAPCRCPLCKDLYSIRPDLNVNTLLSEMVSQFKQEAGSVQVSTPGDVLCDMCTVPKLKALKSCLLCVASYCRTHLQPHLTVSALKTHQLKEPVDNLEDWMCNRHHKPLELFCRTDHSCICTLCALQEHQSHRFVSVKEEFDLQRSSLQQTRAQTQQMVKQRRLKIQEIRRSLLFSDKSVDRERNVGLQAFTALMQSVQRRQQQFIDELQEKHRQTQKQAQDLIQELELEISELEKRSSEVEQLSRSEDHLHFIQSSTSLRTADLKDWSRLRFVPQTCEGSAFRALCELKDTLREEFGEVLKPELKLVQQFEVNLTLDPDTANPYLALSENLKQVYNTDVKMFHDHPRRFSWRNVFAKQSFSSGRFYFEVQVKGKIKWTIGVARASVERKNIKALSRPNGYWSFHMKSRDEYFACEEPRVLLLPLKCAPQKVGVFVDYNSALVSFYDVDTAGLIYTFTNCGFKEKLFPFLNPCYHDEGKNSAPLILTAVKK